MRTSTQLLADHVLGRPVEAWLQERRPNRSYRRLAQDLYRETNGVVDVTDRTVRLWLLAADEKPAEQAS